EPGDIATPRISPDGKTIALVRTDNDNADVWLMDVASKQMTRFTSDPGRESFPFWFPDNRRLLYDSRRGDEELLVERSADGSGSETVRLKNANASLIATAVSPDDTAIVVRIGGGGTNQAVVVRRSVDRPQALGGAFGAFQPLGQWVATVE